VPDRQSLSLQIVECYSCRQQHGAVELKAFAKPPEPWTHFYVCPTNGDPVPVALKMRNGNAIEYLRKVVADLDTAQVRGRWLSAIFYIQEDGGVMLLHNQFDWPHKAFETAIDLFKQQAAKSGGLPEAGPLPIGTPPKPGDVVKIPLAQLFNRNGNGQQQPDSANDQAAGASAKAADGPA
jgi:hypothetical protein